MKPVWGTAILMAVVMATTSCKQIQSQLKEFVESGGPEALPESESLAGADGLPVVTSFQTLPPASFQSFTGAGDRISVVEFYSDT